MDLVERYASSDPAPGPAFLPSFLSHCVPLLQPATDPALWRLVTSLVAHSAPGPGSLAPSRHSSCSASTNTRSATYLSIYIQWRVSSMPMGFGNVCKTVELTSHNRAET